MLKYKTAIKSWCAQIYASIKLIQASKKQRKATNLSESLRVSQNQHIPISTRPIPIYIYPNLITTKIRRNVERNYHRFHPRASYNSSSSD